MYRTRFVTLCAFACAALIVGETAAQIRRDSGGGRVPGAGQPPSVDVNRAAADGSTPLHAAVRDGDIAKVRALIKAGAKVNGTTRYGSLTPLAIAAINADAMMTRTLIEAGADVNARSFAGEPVLMTAARTGNPDVLRLLLAHGADVNVRDASSQQTALMWAAAQDHAAAVKVLADAGADLEARSFAPPPSGRGGRGGVTIAPPGGLNALLYAARQGALESMRVLVDDAGADLNATDPNGISALVYALMNAHYDAAAYLLERGADPNVVDVTGRGPLFAAVDMHTLEGRFNRPNPKQLDRLTPADLVKMLLVKGADPNQKLKGTVIPTKIFATGNINMTAGSTPFLRAATTSAVEVMKLLLEWGADPWATNANGTNALMMVAGINWRVLYSLGTQEEAIEAATLLLDLGFDINEANNLGQTALHGAAMRTLNRDANKLIEFLVERGANLYAKDKKGRTPLTESEGEEITAENGGSDIRGANPRTGELLRELMKKYPERTSAAQK